jgi:predicted GIY-YIG superfamily endonuclease
MRAYKKRKRLEVGYCNNVPKRTKLHADGTSRAAYMREYKKRKRLEESNFNDVPRSVNIQKHIKNLSAEYMHNYRKLRAQENGQEKHAERQHEYREAH